MERLRRKTPEVKPEHITPIKKVFIANRGEIGLRAIRTCDARGIQVAVPYSELPSERNSLITRTVDANTIKEWDLIPVPGIAAEDSYANPIVMLQAAQTCGADAIFLGYGFLAEKAEFAKMCADAGVKVLGPTAPAMDLLGDKVKARELAKKTKIGRRSTIPVLEGTPLLTNFDDLAKAADNTYPVMVKDPNLGGGAGNLIARNREELENAYKTLRVEGNTGLFLERYIEDAIHIEIQVIADKYGNVVALGERDCTMQRKHQKIIEETPSPCKDITSNMRSAMQTAAVNLVKATQEEGKETGIDTLYSGAATVEFIIDRKRKGHKRGDKAWYFMEVNPRIQVEHTVTEESTVIVDPQTHQEQKPDIVSLMIDMAEGKKLSFTQNDVKVVNPAIEVRLYAEDPDHDFEPQEGILSEFKIPKLEGVRVDVGYEEGDEVSTWYDSTLAKLIATGKTREEAREKLVRSLRELSIKGVKTNREFLLTQLDSASFRNGTANTMSVERNHLLQQRERVSAIEKFIPEHGSFVRLPPSRKFESALLSINPTIKSANSDRAKTYREVLDEDKQKTGKETASEYGIMVRDGVKCVVYYLDYRFNGGAFGKAEEWMLEDACKLANAKQLPLITITSTVGINNWQNTHGLDMMQKSVRDLTIDFPPLCHFDVKTGYVFGGVPASYVGVADLHFATDNKRTKIGFTGPYTVAKTQGLEPKSTGAADSYAVLEEGTHSPNRHLQKRTLVDVKLNTMEEISDRITHILHIVKEKHPHIATDPHLTYRPKEQFGYKQSPTLASRFDAPDNPLPHWVPQRLSKLWDKFAQRRDEPVFIGEYEKLKIAERRRIVKHPDRPHALDILDPSWKVFNDVSFLSTPFDFGDLEQSLPIVAAVALVGKDPILVLAETIQKRKTDKGEVVDYDPQKPADWRAMRRYIRWGKKLGLPIVLLGNTLGADCDTPSEDQNQSGEIGQTIRAITKYPFGVVSINYGMGGSGGAVPFIWHADFAAFWENATKWVANAPAMKTFIEGAKLIDEANATKEELAALDSFAEQFIDASAEGQLHDGKIDKILKEGPNGAHVDPRIIMKEMREYLLMVIPILIERQRLGVLLQKRREKGNRISNIGAIPNPNYNEEELLRLVDLIGQTV